MRVFPLKTFELNLKNKSHHKQQDRVLREIEEFCILGDSLSEQGKMDHRKFLYVLPMDFVTGLRKKSPRGAFTNGYAWSTLFGFALINFLIIQKIKNDLDQKNLPSDSTEVSDAWIIKDPISQAAKIAHEATVTDQSISDGNDSDFFRNYAEGGATAHNYKREFTWNISLLLTRLLVTNLDQECNDLIQHDAELKISRDQKEKILIIEWSGANDLITVNEDPSFDIIVKSISARIENLIKLIDAGYQNFALMNLPDLSLTPRYQKKSLRERKLLQTLTQNFNTQLAEKCQIIQAAHPYCRINIIDIYSKFNEVYYNPEAHGFDPKKLTLPYTESKDFKINSDASSPGTGYLFWDDVHPSADAHQTLLNLIVGQLMQGYIFKRPDKDTPKAIYRLFRAEYINQLKFGQNKVFTLFAKSNLAHSHCPEAAIIQIIAHALKGGGERTRQVLIQLKWIDENNRIILTPKILLALLFYAIQHQELHHLDQALKILGWKDSKGKLNLPHHVTIEIDEYILNNISKIDHNMLKSFYKEQRVMPKSFFLSDHRKMTPVISGLCPRSFSSSMI